MSEMLFDAANARIKRGYYQTHETLWYVFRGKNGRRWVAERQDGKRYNLSAKTSSFGAGEVPSDRLYPYDLADICNIIEYSKQKIALVKRHTSNSKLNRAIEERREMYKESRPGTLS